jgi:16S rRNA (cytidine1402-2'-O)-methyltransferase
MTPRAIEVLKDVNVIAAEDTRNTVRLLQHFDIKTKLIAHHSHNEQDSATGIIKLLQSGQDVALVSDAGYPLISDPGSYLVQSVIDAGFNVVPISGSSAVLNALVASGLSPQPFLFYGFLPLQDKECNQELNQLKAYPYTLVFYEAPHRIQKTIQKMIPVMGDRKACLAREITKMYEEFMRGTLSEILENSEDLKGELVLIVEGNISDREKAIDLTEIHQRIQVYIEGGISASQAIKQVAKDTGINKNEIYSFYHSKDIKSDHS